MAPTEGAACVGGTALGTSESQASCSLEKNRELAQCGAPDTQTLCVSMPGLTSSTLTICLHAEADLALGNQHYLAQVTDSVASEEGEVTQEALQPPPCPHRAVLL